MSNVKIEKEEREFILKYFNLGTIDSIEVERYERSQKEKLNVTLAMIIGGKNIHYNVLYTEEKITYNMITDGKQSRTSTINEKINFINKTLEEFNKYYGYNFEKIIITVYDEDINKISNKVKNVKFNVVSREIFNSKIVENKINEDIFYEQAIKNRKIEFKSIAAVKNKVKKMLCLNK